jgi:ubiquitin C-terminal hydrolase
MDGVVLKLFRSSNLQQRIFAVEQMVWWSQQISTGTAAEKNGWCDHTLYVRWLRHNNVLEQLFESDRMRVEIFNRSTKLLLYLAHRLSAGDASALATDDLAIIWKSCLQRDHRIVKSVSLLLIALIKELPVETSLPLFGFWAESTNDDVRELVTLMSSFSTNDDNLLVLSRNRVCSVTSQILWGLIMGTKNREAVSASGLASLIKTLCGILNSSETSGNDEILKQRTFCYRKCIANVLHRDKVHISLDILKETVIENSYISTASSRVYVSRLNEINELCVDINKSGPGLFDRREDGHSGKVHVSLLGVILTAIKWSKLDSRVNKKNTLKQLQFLDAVACRSDVKLGKRELYDIWMSLDSQIGRQALFSWLGETKWSKYPELGAFEEEAREYFFIHLLCEKSDFSKMTSESYQCFCEHFVRLNDDHVVTHFDNIEEVSKRNLLGKKYLWNIMLLAPEKVSSKAMKFFLQLFHALKKDKDTERLTIMEEFLRFVNEDTDGSDPAERTRLHRCFRLLQQMVKEDRDSSDGGGVMRSHSETGRGEPLRITVSAAPKNSDGGLPLKAEATKLSATASSGATLDNLDQKGNIEFTIETHTNAVLWEVRKNISLLLAQKLAQLQINSGIPSVIDDEDYKRLKMSVRGNVLNGRNVLLGWTSLEDGDSIDVETVLFDQEKAGKSPIGRSNLRVLSSLKSRSTSPIDLTDYDGSTFRVEDSSTSSQSKFGTKMSNILRNNNDFYNRTIRLVLKAKHSDHGSSWQDRLWGYLVEAPAWEKVAEVIEAKRTWENFYDEIREYPYRAYFVMAMHARLIPANDGDFGQAVSWRRQFVARGGFLFLLDFFMSHTGHETGNMRRCGLSTALKCVKFLVLGAVQATGTGGSSTPSKASSNASKSFISPPRIGKMFEEDAITPLRTFSAETANRIRDTLEEQDFFLKLASISINLHQRESPQNRKKSGGMVVLNALHAMEELIRGMPEMAHSFSELAIKHKIIELAIHSSSELHRKAASAVIKSLWQSFLVLEREQEGTAPILGHTLSCAIQENISSLNGSSNGRYLELSQAVEFHIRQCISGNSQDEKRRNWNLALETLLYTLPNDSSDRDGTVSESRCFDPANGMRKENILSGILSNLVALTSTSDSNVANVGLLRFIVQRCLFYVPKERKDTGRALCRTGKTRALAFHLLNSNSRDSGVREDVFVNIYSLYESLQEQESFLSLPASMRWKYDPSDAELKPHGFCGLTNQGATCYMNSLLQQFFMCDKIREGVLAAEFDEDVQPDNVTSILKELKRAFTFLQNSESKSFNTTAFVESCRPLGLTNDILSQNDTAEFCDKLVDCLEVVLKGTWKVFSGLVMHETDFVGVQYRSEREQPFIFLPLPIVGTPVATLEKSLQEFVKAEKMDGENQVECEEAGNRKFDAFRRDWVSQLPELLIVHLKRWQLDYQTFAMKKINSRCEFPMELDMMPYVKQRGSSSAPRDDEASYKYALSGILVHRGPAGGGHYFSIIKDRASGKWYKFNDETVVEFQAGRIDAASFGRSNGDQSAYMLFYDRLNRSWPGQTGSESRIINKGVVPDSCTSFQARLDTEMSNYNASFIQRQFLYDPELAKFLYNDMNAFDYDIDDKKMALAFFMDVLARSYHTTILAQFVECLVRHLRSDEQLSSWVLKQFCNTSAQDWGGSWLDGLVECSEKSKRHATGRIIRTAVSTCAKAAGKLEQGSDMYGHVNLFCGIFMNMMWKVAKKWRQSTEYFDCLRQIAKQKLCAQLFVETGAIPRLVHYFLGSESTNADFPPLLSWESASSSWGYATEPPDRTLPLKVLVSLSEYAQGQMLGDVNDTDMLRCGDAFYKYAVDLFDGGTAPFRLIERIASTEGIVLEDLKQKLFIGKLACEGESNSITFGSKEMYTGSMYAIATIFVMNHEVPIDGIVTSARLCITNHRERPSTKASCDYEVCVYEKANRERDPICFDDGTKLTVKYIGKEEVRTFEPGHRVSAMKIDATTGDMGDFENGMIKEVDPESGTYTVYFDDTTVAPNVIGDFISASAAPFPEDRQCFTIVARRSIDVDVRKAEVQEFFDLDMPVKKGQYIGIVNHIDKLWLSWEQQWKSSDEFHFKNWYTTKYTATKKSNSRQEGSTVMNLRMSTSRPQYSVKIVSLAERKKVT